MAEPPLCTLHDLTTWMTLDDLMDLHEVLDLKQAMFDKAERVSRAPQKKGFHIP
jgi:hypothetical protein